MSRTRSLGLALLGLLSLIDVAGPLLTDGDHPPMAVALVGSAIGLASLVCIAYVVRGASRAMVPLVVLRIVSALSAVPAFFADGVPAGIAVLAGALLALTAAGCWLVLAPSQEVQVR